MPPTRAGPDATREAALTSSRRHLLIYDRLGASAVSLGPGVTIVLLALVLAIEPWAVLAAVLLASSTRGGTKSLAFLIGWAAALSALGFAGVLLAPHLPAKSTSSTALSGFDLAVGLLTAGWLTLRWRHVPAPVAGTGTGPKWMGHVDTMSPLVALALGAFLPTYMFVVASVSQLLQSGLSKTDQLVGITLFVVVASLGVAAPLLLILVKRDRAPEINQRMRVWLVANTRLVMFSLGWILSGLLIIRGLVGLLS